MACVQSTPGNWDLSSCAAWPKKPTNQPTKQTNKNKKKPNNKPQNNNQKQGMWIIVVYFKWYRVNFLKEPVRFHAGPGQDLPKAKAKCTGETHSFTSRVQGCVLSVLWELFPLAPRPPSSVGSRPWRMFTYMCPILRIPAAPSCHLARWCLGAAASDSWRRRPGSVCPGWGSVHLQIHCFRFAFGMSFAGASFWSPGRVPRLTSMFM